LVILVTSSLVAPSAPACTGEDDHRLHNLTIRQGAVDSRRDFERTIALNNEVKLQRQGGCEYKPLTKPCRASGT